MVLVVTIIAIVIALVPATRLIFKYASNQTLWFFTITASIIMLFTPLHEFYFNNTLDIWSRVIDQSADERGWIRGSISLYTTMITYGIIFFSLGSLYFHYIDKRRMRLKRTRQTKQTQRTQSKRSKRRKTKKKRRKRT